MKRAAFTLFAGAALSLLGLSARAQFAYQVTNLTFSGGDPIYPITNDVTFQNLVLSETFTDATMVTVPLYDPADPTHTPTNTLDTGMFNLESDVVPFTDPVHGAVASATLTGSFDLTNLDIQTTFGGSTTNVNVNQNFTTTLILPLSAGFTNINAIDSTSSAAYGAGTVGVFAVPEPGSLAFLTACSLGLVSVLRRRRSIKR